MNLLHIVLITIQLAYTLARRHQVSASDESIENLLYFKDCHVETTEAPRPEPQMLRKPEPPSCPYPKMCCSLSCNNDCGGSSPFSTGDMRMSGVGGISPIGMGGPEMGGLRTGEPQNGAPGSVMNMPFQASHPGAPRRRKKKIPMDLLPPIGARREFGFTKEKIKGLISKDTDIRKILRDLVRVTMKKVDLVEMINARKAQETRRMENSRSDDDDLQ